MEVQVIKGCISYPGKSYLFTKIMEEWASKTWQHSTLQCLVNKVGNYKLIRIALSQEFSKLDITRIVVTWMLNWDIIQVLFGVVSLAPKWLIDKVHAGKLVMVLIFLLSACHGLGQDLAFLLLTPTCWLFNLIPWDI